MRSTYIFILSCMYCTLLTIIIYHNILNVNNFLLFYLFIFYLQTDNIYNNTRFSVSDRQIANPLYNASLQSPDSITGYSMEEQTIDIEEQKK